MNTKLISFTGAGLNCKLSLEEPEKTTVSSVTKYSCQLNICSLPSNRLITEKNENTFYSNLL